MCFGCVRTMVVSPSWFRPRNWISLSDPMTTDWRNRMKSYDTQHRGVWELQMRIVWRRWGGRRMENSEVKFCCCGLKADDARATEWSSSTKSNKRIMEIKEERQRRMRTVRITRSTGRDDLEGTTAQEQQAMIRNEEAARRSYRLKPRSKKRRQRAKTRTNRPTGW